MPAYINDNMISINFSPDYLSQGQTQQFAVVEDAQQEPSNQQSQNIVDSAEKKKNL